MTDLLQLLIAGLATGAIYALAAIGFTLLWQTSQTINFAQGEFVMVPAFLALIAMKWFGVPFLARAGARRPGLDAAAGRGLPLRRGGAADQARRPAAGRLDHRAQHHPEGIGEGLLQRRGPDLPDPAARYADHRGRRRGVAGAARRAGRVAAGDRAAAVVPGRHAHRPADAGDGAEPDGGAHPGRAGRAHDPLHLPDQRGAGRHGLDPDLADLPRQVLQRRDAGPGRLRGGDRRRLQPGARRHRRRPADRRVWTISPPPTSRPPIARPSR